MDEYDRIENYNSSKYSFSKKIDNFWFIIFFYGDQNIF
jgi:hypothetical protein